MAKEPPNPRPASGAKERAAIEACLSRLEGCPVKLIGAETLGADRATSERRRSGVGMPLLLLYRARGTTHRAVLRSPQPSFLGHDRRADRAALALLSADTFGDQPHHVRVLDVGALHGDEYLSLRGTGEFYLLTTFAEGAPYLADLQRIETTLTATDLDVERASALARHLAEVHNAQPASCNPEVYTRAIRDVIGGGEGIFGVADAYPEDFARRDLLTTIEELALRVRTRVGRDRTWRLRRTHGDFQPHNVIFREGTDLTILDGKRGGAGEPADDLAAMSFAFVMWGLKRPRAWPTGFKLLFDTFLSTYLDATGDEGALEQAPLFFAWRALAHATPTASAWLEDTARFTLLETAAEWLRGGRFDPASVESDLPMLAARSI